LSVSIVRGDIHPLDEDSVRQVVNFLKKEKVEAIVISLFSFLNPVHEKKVAIICKEIFPEALISLSSEVCPSFANTNEPAQRS
jgi:N-methylhydantoinase A